MLKWFSTIQRAVLRNDGKRILIKVQIYALLKCKIVQCSVHKSVQCWNAKPFNIQFTKSVQCWNAKPFNVQFTKVSSAGMSKGNVEQLMSTKSILGASGVIISTRCKAQRKVQRQDVKVLRYAK